MASFLKPIGLNNQKALRLKNLANTMIIRNGNLPLVREELEQIPFFGQYMVNAVYQLIHNQPEPLLDGNMARLLERVFEKRKRADIRFDKDLQFLAKRIVSHSNSRELNWAILDYASEICNIQPKCINCILNSICNYQSKI